MVLLRVAGGKASSGERGVGLVEEGRSMDSFPLVSGEVGRGWGALVQPISVHMDVC